MNFLAKVAKARLARAEVQIVVYTDGGCCMKKGKVGAYAWKALYDNGGYRARSDAMFGTTVNRMELAAIISALETLPIGVPYLIKSDSAYCVNGLSGWLQVWSRNGWFTSAGEPVKNQDLWERLVDLLRVQDVRFEHVRGHSGDPYNDAVDHMCTCAMASALERQAAGENVPIDDWGGS
jgi:ribonuclease HI